MAILRINTEMICGPTYPYGHTPLTYSQGLFWPDIRWGKATTENSAHCQSGGLSFNGAWQMAFWELGRALIIWCLPG